MKSLEFFKPTLATTLAIVVAWLLSVRPAQAGYTVTLQQVGPNVVATGSGAIDLTGLTFNSSTSSSPEIHPADWLGAVQVCNIHTGPPSSSVDTYLGALSGPTSFGSLPLEMSASSGSGDMVGIAAVSAPCIYRNRCQCSKRLCLRNCSVGPGDLQRQDFCNPRRNTGHLPMDLGSGSEPELHA